ncbi:MAG: GGDEF domain-containing protein [Gammaproteobacteria bacterium]|nr:GGDEF domain-containing protein [Gammaproteobacteria bacterium]
MVTFADLSQTKRIHDELRHLATHDNLTDLPNRRLFLDRLDQGVRRAAANNDSWRYFSSIWMISRPSMMIMDIM